jgi:hypothetical protein
MRVDSFTFTPVLGMFHPSHSIPSESGGANEVIMNIHVEPQKDEFVKFDEYVGLRQPKYRNFTFISASKRGPSVIE